MARNKSILDEAKQVERAVELIKLGARLQVLESETDLSYERLLRLYKEVAGRSPSKGQLPFSTDWSRCRPRGWKRCCPSPAPGAW